MDRSESLFGKAVAPYAKAWSAFAGYTLTAVASGWPGAPDWVGIAGGIVTTVGVYLIPNEPYNPRHGA